MKRIFLLLATMMIPTTLPADESMPLTLVNVIALPGVEGRFDHGAIDIATNRVFFAALGNNTVEVVDYGFGKRLHTIPGLKKPTGILFLADCNVLVVANGDDGTCRFYDGTSYVERGRISGLDDADNLRFDTKSNQIFVGYGAGAIGKIDPSTMKLIGSMHLAKHPEAFEVEAHGVRIFVNVPDAKQIAVVDRLSKNVVSTWQLDGVNGNFPMAFDELNHRLFVGCREPARLLMFDTQSGRRIADTVMSGDVDDIFFDAATNRLFASCGEGFIDVFRYHQPSTLVRTHQIPSAAGARTALFSSKGSSLFLAVPHRGAQRAELQVYTVPGNRNLDWDFFIPAD